MTTEAQRVVTDLWAAWLARDKAGMLALCSADITYAIHIPQHTLPAGGGHTTGRAALSDRLQSLLDQFDVLFFRPKLLSVRGPVVRAQVHFHYRHAFTGEDIEGSMRQLFVVRDGQVISYDELHDVDRFSAFMRHASAVAARRARRRRKP
jgi:ketosteroid isomerase-like protein